MLRQVLEILAHALQLQEHVVELLLYPDLLYLLYEFFDFYGAFLLLIKYLRNLKEFQYLVRPGILIDRMRLNVLDINRFAILRLLDQHHFILICLHALLTAVYIIVAIANVVNSEVAIEQKLVAERGHFDLGQVGDGGADGGGGLRLEQGHVEDVDLLQA